MWQPVTYSVEPCRAEVLSPKMFSNGLFKNSYNVLDLPEAGRGSRVRSGRLKMIIQVAACSVQCITMQSGGFVTQDVFKWSFQELA